MTNFISKASALALMLAAGLMAGCGSGGGGGGGGGDDSSTKTGQFVDSPVSGISYSASPSGKSGVTDAEGKFDYQEGDVVTFSIGSIVFPGGIPQDGIITPAHLAGTADWQNSDLAINMIRFLLTLDEDDNPDNGIQIPLGAGALATTAIDFSDTTAFDTDAGAFFTSLSSETFTYSGLVSNDDATEHFNDSLTDVGIEIEIEVSNTQLIGSWYYTEEGGLNSDDVHIVLTFIDNNTYVIANDEADSDENGNDGFEVGNYSLSSSGVFEADVIVDTNGEWGFSNCENEILNLAVLGDTLQLTEDGEVDSTCGEEGSEVLIELTRVSSSTDDLIGSWLVDIDLANNKFALVSFMENGTYMHLSNSTASEDGEPGIERGTYEIDPETNALTYTAITDTNGEWGLSHPCESEEFSKTACPLVTFVVDGDVLIYTEGTDISELERVK